MHLCHQQWLTVKNIGLCDVVCYGEVALFDILNIDLKKVIK